jgi:hypothetical protein
MRVLRHSSDQSAGTQTPVPLCFLPLPLSHFFVMFSLVWLRSVWRCVALPTAHCPLPTAHCPQTKLRRGHLACVQCMVQREEQAIREQIAAVESPLPPQPTAIREVKDKARPSLSGPAGRFGLQLLALLPLPPFAHYLCLILSTDSKTASALTSTAPLSSASAASASSPLTSTLPSASAAAAAPASALSNTLPATTASTTAAAPASASAPSATATAAAAPAPSVLEWKRGDLLGVGTFGRVYQALDTLSGALIAVKQVPLEKMSAEQRQQMQTEVGVMETLRHEHIVSFLGTQQFVFYSFFRPLFFSLSLLPDDVMSCHVM